MAGAYAVAPSDGSVIVRTLGVPTILRQYSRVVTKQTNQTGAASLVVCTNSDVVFVCLNQSERPVWFVWSV
jgi:hypothetical protein